MALLYVVIPNPRVFGGVKDLLLLFSSAVAQGDGF
jgi:hypothetical protein